MSLFNNIGVYESYVRYPGLGEFFLIYRSPIILSILGIIISSLIIIVMLLLQVAFYTLGERKLMGAIQRRRGPDVNGIFGLLQPFLDGLKLILKETIIPQKANVFYFLFGPVLFLSLSLCNWAVIPFNGSFSFTYIKNSVLIQLMFSSLTIYGIVISGWASNSKYSLLGSIRAVAQLISYELPMTLCLLIITLRSESFNFIQIYTDQMGGNLWNIFLLFPVFLIYLICMIAETNRAPFDLPEAEAELVAGYNVEYSAIGFAMFFLGEYSNMILSAYLIVFFFLGGPSGLVFFPFLALMIKVNFILMFFVILRATIPRYRYDQLMALGWKVLLPLSFVLFICEFIIMASTKI